MSQPGSDSEEGSESPILGFSTGIPEQEKEEPKIHCDVDLDMKMESNDLENAAGPSEEKVEELKPPPQLKGFSTASGKIIQVSEKALQMAKKKMELMDGWVDAGENVGPSDENEKTSRETMPVLQFKGLFTANGKSIAVSKKVIEAAKKPTFDDFRKENILKNKSTPVSCFNTTFVFGNENRSRLSTAESNEVEDCTRLLLEDISAEDETEWDDMQQENQPVNRVAAAVKKIIPVFNVRKPLTTTKRLNMEPPDLSNLSNPAKHGRLSKKFVPPRRKDSE